LKENKNLRVEADVRNWFKRWAIRRKEFFFKRSKNVNSNIMNIDFKHEKRNTVTPTTHKTIHFAAVQLSC
jgi:hypothetical protein